MWLLVDVFGGKPTWAVRWFPSNVQLPFNGRGWMHSEPEPDGDPVDLGREQGHDHRASLRRGHVESVRGAHTFLGDSMPRCGC